MVVFVCVFQTMLVVLTGSFFLLFLIERVFDLLNYSYKHGLWYLVREYSLTFILTES